jgi:hypothetical protein
MEIASIKGDTVLFLYHPAETPAEVGQQFAVVELPNRTEGLVVQVISNDSLEYAGLEQEMIQRILEQRIAQHTLSLLDRERGMGEIKSLKMATAKIRKRIRGNEWRVWDGWIPTRNVDVSLIGGTDLLSHVIPGTRYPLSSFVRFGETQVQFDGPRLKMVNVVTGVKGSGKSHLAKHLVLTLSDRQIPCIVFDLNGEYVGLPNAQELRWGENMVFDLAEVGYQMLELMVKNLYPLQPGSPSESVFESQLPRIFRDRRTYCGRNNRRFTIDVPYLHDQNWQELAGPSGAAYVAAAIQGRLDMIDQTNAFWREHPRVGDTPNPFYSTPTPTSFQTIYDNACTGHPIVFDMRNLRASLQRALVNSVNDYLEDICERETQNGTRRYPFVFYEEAHFYMEDAATLNIITRGRHIGIASVFVTNTPQKLPETVFRQLDNLFLLVLTHRDDIRNVSRNSFTDEDTIQSFATRMPERHALIIGDITDRYPLVVSVDPLPPTVPQTGRTRSTWDRFDAQ